MVSNPIRDARCRRRLSRDDLGRIVGVSGRTISYWESWEKSPDSRKSAVLKSALGLSDVDIWRIMHHASPKAKMPERRSAIW